MRGYHWGMIFLFLAVGYMLATWIPGPGQRLKAMLGA